jgi:hypothetical protein
MSASGTQSVVRPTTNIVCGTSNHEPSPGHVRPRTKSTTRPTAEERSPWHLQSGIQFVARPTIRCVLGFKYAHPRSSLSPPPFTTLHSLTPMDSNHYSESRYPTERDFDSLQPYATGFDFGLHRSFNQHPCSLTHQHTPADYPPDVLLVQYTNAHDPTGISLVRDNWAQLPTVCPIVRSIDPHSWKYHRGTAHSLIVQQGSPRSNPRLFAPSNYSPRNSAHKKCLSTSLRPTQTRPYRPPVWMPQVNARQARRHPKQTSHRSHANWRLKKSTRPPDNRKTSRVLTPLSSVSVGRKGSVSPMH